jgi:hypothetical protein
MAAVRSEAKAITHDRSPFRSMLHTSTINLPGYEVRDLVGDSLLEKLFWVGI